jgi:hypothetical protein
MDSPDIDHAQFLQVEFEVRPGTFNEGPEFREFAGAKLPSQPQNRKFSIGNLVVVASWLFGTELNGN